MRVIAGRLGGRRLQAPRGRVTRPTSDRVREALFAMLGERRGRAACSTCSPAPARSGSRRSRAAPGAPCSSSATRSVVRVLNDNLSALGIAARGARRCAARTRWRRCGAHGRRKETYDLVFIDPPYGQASSAIGDRWGPELSAILPSAARARGARRRRERPPRTAPARHGGRAAKTLRRHFDHNPPPSMNRPEKSSPCAPAPMTRSPTGTST